jgi:hypothetical protein
MVGWVKHPVPYDIRNREASPTTLFSLSFPRRRESIIACQRIGGRTLKFGIKQNPLSSMKWRSFNFTLSTCGRGIKGEGVNRESREGFGMAGRIPALPSPGASPKENRMADFIILVILSAAKDPFLYNCLLFAVNCKPTS